MLSRSEVKYIQSLCQKKQRQAESLFLAEGPKLADEILKSGYTIKRIYALKSWIIEHPEVSANISEIDEKDLDKISSLQTPNQVLMIVEQPNQEALPLIEGKLSLVLDGIQDPGNMGTIIRIADWFGIRQIFCSPDTVDIYNPKVIQGTMGSIVRTSINYLDLHAFLTTVNIPVWGALLNGISVHEVGKPLEALLVIGNEGKGIRDPLLPLITKAVTIPRLGNAESLNAAVATGIILSHIC